MTYQLPAAREMAAVAMDLRRMHAEIPHESAHLAVRRSIVRTLRGYRLAGIILRRDPPLAA